MPLYIDKVLGHDEIFEICKNYVNMLNIRLVIRDKEERIEMGFEEGKKLASLNIYMDISDYDDEHAFMYLAAEIRIYDLEKHKIGYLKLDELDVEGYTTLIDLFIMMNLEELYKFLLNRGLMI